MKSSPPVADSDDENAEGWHDEVVTEGVDKYPKSDYNILRMKNPISDIFLGGESMKNIGAERQLSEYNHVYKENTAIYRDLSVRMGMTESTFWILYTLRVEEAPVTQSDMCAILGYPKQTVNSALKKLEQEGLLTLSGGRGRGGRPIRLTETGMKLAEQTIDFVIEAEQRALLDLSSEEQAQLLTLMRRYNDALTFHFSAIDKENTHE